MKGVYCSTKRKTPDTTTLTIRLSFPFVETYCKGTRLRTTTPPENFPQGPVFAADTSKGGGDSRERMSAEDLVGVAYRRTADRRRPVGRSKTLPPERRDSDTVPTSGGGNSYTSERSVGFPRTRCCLSPVFLFGVGKKMMDYCFILTLDSVAGTYISPLSSLPASC
jgi:hypothetical protein